jgi:hypothetical protein
MLSFIVSSSLIWCIYTECIFYKRWCSLGSFPSVGGYVTWDQGSYAFTGLWTKLYYLPKASLLWDCMSKEQDIETALEEVFFLGGILFIWSVSVIVLHSLHNWVFKTVGHDPYHIRSVVWGYVISESIKEKEAKLDDEILG